MSLSPPAVLLAAAHVLLTKRWCQGARALDEYGVPVSPLGPRAVAWDLTGALQRAAYFILALPAGGSVYQEPVYREARAALERHCRLPKRLPDPLEAYNDTPGRTQTEILALLAAALKTFLPPGNGGGNRLPPPEPAPKPESDQQ